MLYVRTLLVGGGVVILTGIAAVQMWKSEDLPSAVVEIGSSAIDNPVVPLTTFDTWAADEHPPLESVRGRNEQLRNTKLLRDEIASLRSDLDAMKSKLSSVAATVATLSARTDTTIAADGHLMEDASAMEARLAEQDEQQDRYLDQIETSLLSEPSDPQWSNQAIYSIEQAWLSEHVTDATLVAVDCRSTLCRVEVKHEGPQALAQLHIAFSQLIGEAGLQPAIVSTETEDDWSNTVIYMTRDNYRLPDPNP